MCKEKYHENEPVEYYCEDCRVCICLKCGQTCHNHHNKMDIQHVAEERKTLMMKLFDRVKAKAIDVEAKMKEETEWMKKSEQEILVAEKEMVEIVEERIHLLNEHKIAIKAELTKILEAQQTKHASNMKNIEMFATQLRSSLEFGEDIVKRTGPEILEAEPAVYSRCEEILNSKEVKLFKPPHVNYVSRGSFLNGQVVVTVRQFDPSKSTVEGEGLKETELGAEAEFSVTLRDSEGNLFHAKEIQPTVKICSPTGEDMGKKIKDHRDGNYTVSYKPKRVGVHEIVVETNGKSLIGSPWRVQVTPHRYKIIGSFGSYGRGHGQFVFPWSIAVCKRTGNIAVADFTYNRVKLHDSNCKYLRMIGDKGTGAERIGNPTSVAFTASDDVIVIHGEQPRKMSVFTERGDFITHITEHLINPWSVSVRTDGRLLVCDVGDNTVKLLSPDGTQLMQTVRAPDCDEHSFYAVYHQDMFFVSYQWADCVKVFNKNGLLLYEIGCKGSGDGQLIRPTGLTIDRFGNLVVCDSDKERLQFFSLEGKFLNSLDEGIQVSASVAVTMNSDLLVCDAGKRCIHILR